MGFDFQAALTIVIASEGKSAIENFEQFELARGIAGELYTGSFGFLGDVNTLNLYGIMIGGGVGGGPTPGGGYVGAMREVLFEF